MINEKKNIVKFLKICKNLIAIFFNRVTIKTNKMKVKKIFLKNFRNYEHCAVEFFDGVNILQGKNAQGKTNLLEAIYFCSIGKSLRVGREKEVINFKSDTSKIKLLIEKKYKNSEIYLIFSKFAKKTIKVDNIPIKKIGELLGEFNAVYFSPDELKLIKESPEDRRRFIDIHISQTSKQYFYLLGRYEKILLSRNRILKENYNNKNLKDLIEIYNKQLIDIGSNIILYRLDFVRKLSPIADDCHKYLTNNNENLKIIYTGINENNLQAIKNMFKLKLEASFEKDLKLGFTTVGPHRDDLKILINDIDIRIYGSQGQQRTVALSLKLAELEIIKQEVGEMPVLLLDDVLSELDVNRRNRLLKFCTKTQTFITGTDFEYNKDYHYFKTDNGVITNINPKE